MDQGIARRAFGGWDFRRPDLRTGRHHQVVVGCYGGEVREACCDEDAVGDQRSSKLHGVVATQLMVLGQADRPVNDGATDG